jgi:uncharacterized membrane protein
VLTATLLALGAAGVHAAWNLLIKTSGDRALAAWGQFAAAAAIGAVTLLLIGPPGVEALPYLVATGLIHIGYVEGLAAAYTHGDFSLSYPLARGAGAVLAAVGSVALLDDTLSGGAWLSILVAAIGLASLRVGRGVPAADDVVLDVPDEPDEGASPPADERRALVYALATAACIATYTLVDSAGAREVSSGASYGVASVTAAGLAVTLANLVRPTRRARIGEVASGWRRHVAGGAGTLIAYTMVLVAVREAPVGYVTMLRESSVVIGAVLGWLVLHEALGRRRLASSAVILLGLVGLVASGG